MEALYEHLIDMSDSTGADDWNVKIKTMYTQQLKTWTMAGRHYKQLEHIKQKHMNIDGIRVDVQFNQERARSTCTHISKSSVEKRPCFLCVDKLPKEQRGHRLLNCYLLLINPFPIFRQHLTLSELQHQPQKIKGRIRDMLEIAYKLSDFTVFYNGPKCGASAPDHFHFQAVRKGHLPVETEMNTHTKKSLYDSGGIHIFEPLNYLRKAIILESEYIEPIDYFFNEIYTQLPLEKEWNEPMMNVLAMYRENRFLLIIFPRKAQRPSCYFAEEPDRIIVGPASVEMGGVLITPREKDFNRMNAVIVREIFGDVSEFEIKLKF